MFLPREIKELPTSLKDLRKFAFTVGIVFFLLGGLFLWKGKSLAPWFIGIGATLLFFGAFFPRVLKPVYFAWMGLALVLGWVMTRVILSVIFYAVITPISLLMRFQKKDILNTHILKEEKSYWTNRVPREKTSYEKQY